MKKNGHVGPTKKKRQTNKRKWKEENKSKLLKIKSSSREVSFFLVFIFSNLLYRIYENLTVEFRQDKHEKCSMRRGLRVSTRNTGFH